MTKLLLLFTICSTVCANAQITHTLPPEASAFYTAALNAAKPEIISFVEKKSTQLSGVTLNADSLLNTLQNETALKALSKENLRAVGLLILIRCSYNTDLELKEKVLQMQKHDKGDLNFDKTAPLIERKSDIALQVTRWYRQINDQSAVLRGLQ